MKYMTKKCCLLLSLSNIEVSFINKALTVLLTVQISCGDHTGAQSFLVDAEYLIRKRGLPKSHKSLKVRSVHHVYTYLCIMAESTCGCALLNICPDRPSSSVMKIDSSFSFRSFRVAYDSTDADLDMELEKNDEVGQNDIHLEVMGPWKETLYPDIYGVLESLMALLSETIRLANEQELLNRCSTVDTQVLEDLRRRASLLEQYILSWKPSSGQPFALRDHPAIDNGEITKIQAADYMVRAMRQALILFYYRRIPNINALILQDTVQRCYSFLQQSDQACINGDMFNDTAVLWPGFVAACEALNTDLQSQLLEWLLTTGQRTSLPSFLAAAQSAQMVWKGRYETKDYTLSWFDVMKQKRCPIIVT